MLPNGKMNPPKKKTQTNTVISGSVRAFRAKYFPQVPGKTDETRVPQGDSNSNRGVSLEEFSHSITGKFLGSSFCVYHTHAAKVPEKVDF